MPFYVYAWVATTLYGLYVITAKLTSKYQLKNAWQLAFFSILFHAIYTTVVPLKYGATLPTIWTFVGLAALTSTLSNVLFISALSRLDVTVLSPLYNIRAVMTVLLGHFLLGEIITWRSGWLIVIITVAGFFTATDERFHLKSFFSKNVALGLIYMLNLSFYVFFVNRAIAQVGYWAATLWIGLISVGMGVLFYLPRFYKELKKTKIIEYSGVFAMALMGGLGDLAANKAYEGNVGISSVIVSLPISMMLAFLFSIFKPSLLEKHTLKVYLVRFSAAGIMMWGALQLSR